MKPIWLKQYPPQVSPQLIEPTMSSLVDYFKHYCREYADLKAFTNCGQSITYRQLAQYTRALAGYWQQVCGLKKGDRVAIMMPNVLPYPIAVFSILMAGCTVVNINPLYTARELSQQLNDSGATAIIASSIAAKTVEKVLDDTMLEHVIVTDLGDLLSWIKRPIVNYVAQHVKKVVPEWSMPQAVSLRVALDIGRQQVLQSVLLQPSDLAFLQYTGGTTGLPKGAMLTHANMLANAAQLTQWVESILIPGKDVVITCLPLYHIFSLLVSCIAFIGCGVECLLVTNPRDVDGFVKLLRHHYFSVFVGINTLFNALLHHPQFNKINFSALKYTASGGMATQAEVAKRWQAATGAPVSQGYGLTETSPVVSLNAVNCDHFNGSAGLPMPGTEIMIRDPQGHSLAVGDLGEICVRGPQVMQGYWQKTAETARVLDQQGWLRTGDIGCIDDEGYLRIVDRKKDLIIVSGFNVYPNEVEEVLVQHPDVIEAAVIGIASDKTGEAVKAVIVRSNPQLDEKMLIAFCREHLTAYKVPKSYEFSDDLPKSAVGKVLRRALRDEEVSSSSETLKEPI